MADFCKQCSIQHFGTDYGELANLCSAEEAEHRIYATALCEGCGPICVDHRGMRMGPKGIEVKREYTPEQVAALNDEQPANDERIALKP